MKHIEDRTVAEFIEIIRSFNKYTISEKIDGSSLSFGIEGRRFYTKYNNKKHFSVDDYAIQFSTTYQRSAHLALQQIVPTLVKAKLIKEADEIEVEVLYGPLPNVVNYTSDTHKVVLLRTLTGDCDLHKIEQCLKGTIINQQVYKPCTLDSKTTTYVNEHQKWTFHLTPSVHGISIEKSDGLSSIVPLCEFLEQFMNVSSGFYNYSNKQVMEMKLNKCIKEVSIKEWKTVKNEAKRLREQLRNFAMVKVMQIKEVLLDYLVRQTSSAFGKADDHNGWIEGVVCINLNDNIEFKIVDKNTFLKVKDFLWKERDGIAKVSKSIQDDDMSIVGDLKYRLADCFGTPKLATTQCKPFLREHGDTKEEILDFFEGCLSFKMIHSYWQTELKYGLEEIDESLAMYEVDRLNYSLEINHIGTFKYDGEVDYRTRCVYVVAREYITKLTEDVNKATTVTDLLEAFVGKQLSEI